jgi:hypothetical protein
MATHTHTTKAPAKPAATTTRSRKASASTAALAQRIKKAAAEDVAEVIELKVTNRKASTTKATPRTRKAKAAPAPTPTPILADNDGPATPTGYVVRWPHGGYDLLRSDGTTEGPAWLVRCNVHGATTEAANTKSGDQLGRKADRATWCAGCKKAAK